MKKLKPWKKASSVVKTVTLFEGKVETVGILNRAQKLKNKIKRPLKILFKSFTTIGIHHLYNMTSSIIFIALCVCALIPHSVIAVCDNLCSGRGTCQADDVCKCYDNWGVGLTHTRCLDLSKTQIYLHIQILCFDDLYSGDCSDRICPYELAWVDKPNYKGTFHGYAECAGRGVCNRETGECQCFDGYEGKACSRTSCPNDCSGHGTCEFIDDLTYKTVHIIFIFFFNG